MLPLGQQHEVARHQVGGGDALLNAIAQDTGVGGEQPPQRFGCPFGFELLPEAKSAIDHHHQPDGDPQLGQLGKEGNHPTYP